MNRIRIDNPKGIAPGIAPYRLPVNFAQKAYNCKFDKGVLDAMADLNIDTTFTAPGALRSLYKYDAIWLYWLESDINAIRLQLAASNDRVMYTGDGYPKQLDSNIMAASGIPTTDQATITGASKAATCVITATAHGFSNADVVGISGIVGMDELNGRNFTVANKADNTFELTGVNSSAYDAYSSGGVAYKARSHRRVGIVAPTDLITAAGGGPDDTVSKYELIYVYTYVVKWADGTEEESPPSGITELTINGGGYVLFHKVIIPNGAPTLLASGNAVTHVRVYRSTNGGPYRQIKARATSQTETTLFWYDIPVAYWPAGTVPNLYDSDGTGFDIWDNSADNEIQTTDWDNPPTNLAGLIQYQNGILAGFSGRKVCVSEPFVHYAWPEGNQIEVDFDIIALGVYAKSLIVGTKAYPYVVYGTNVSTL